MNKRKPITPRQLGREKILFRYSSALERGDFDTLGAILREAETDPMLAKMLAEMDAVYRVEIAPLPALPSLSANHNHHHTREDETMNTTYPTISRRLSDTRLRGRWNSAATLAAALIALVLFAALLIARRPPLDPQQGSLAAVLLTATVTPLPSVTATPFPTFTPSPFGGVNGEFGTLTPVNPDSSQGVLCQAFVNLASGIDVLSRPSEFGVVIGHVPLGTQVNISDTSLDSTFWFFVNAIVDGIPVQGWVSGGDLSFYGDHSCPMPPEIQSMQATSEAMGIQPISPDMALTLTAMLPCSSQGYTVTPTFTPTPASQPDTAVEPIDATATFVIDSTLLPTFVHTVVPPCTLPFTPTLVPYIPLDATPIAGFDRALRAGSYDVLTIEAVDRIPANTRVRILSGHYNDGEWTYEVLAQDSQAMGMARQSQLQYAPDFVPAATPTALFNSALGSGMYAAITNQPVGDIPAGTRVQVGSAWYTGIEWYYNISDASGRQNTARESQLDFAPDYTSAMPTPTAAYFDLRGQVLLTLERVGDIPANTPVQATSGYYDGTEWVYGVMALDGNAAANARASQLRAVSLEQAGVQPTLPPTVFPPTPPSTPPPTLTLTPFA